MNSMQITYLGHAGFYVETQACVIMMDPWLSRGGAFDASWFQYPDNAGMQERILAQFEESPKDKYIYISHEHKDHFDLPFLQSIQKRNFQFILARFHRSVVKEQLLAVNYACEGIIELGYDGEHPLSDGSIRLFVLDAELDCDSAILVKTATGSFLNINDCKLHEKLEKINNQYGPFDVFAGQFSGAIWHPVCYEMPEADYQRISEHKKANKFMNVKKAIETLNPRVYLPSAGPPCFLDPLLYPINTESINIFPRAAEFIRYLEVNCQATQTRWPDIMPGDILDVARTTFIHQEMPRITENEVGSYLQAYAQRYAAYFKAREQAHASVVPEAVFMALRAELQKKLDAMRNVYQELKTPLYWSLSDYPGKKYRIQFYNKRITEVSEIAETSNYWSIEAPAWQVDKVLSGEMNWPDFVLTFRVQLVRKPDRYDSVIHGFIALDACEIRRFCDLVMQFRTNTGDRIVVECEGKQYSILRWCPHLGGDLSAGRLENGSWVCPRHHWHYDLKNKGQCLTSTETIDAICLNPEGKE